MDITELYKTQISLTEWLEKSGNKLTSEIKLEDNSKRERLTILNELISLPFDKSYNFQAKEIAEPTEEFNNFLKEHGNELCAFRLIPNNTALPKLRMRGYSIKKSIDWFNEQNIEPDNYKVEIVPHSEQNIYSTIFLVNSHGIFGEIINGGHYQLTQGFYDKTRPTMFSFDFKKWTIKPYSKEIENELNKITSKLLVEDGKVRENIKNKLNSNFSNNYLNGYFETVTTQDKGLWFIDYNRILGDIYKDYVIKETPTSQPSLLEGLCASPGKFTGIVRVVNSNELEKTVISKNEILVCKMTTPDYIQLMNNSGAIITDLGGILSHAAIISRELAIPCLVGTKNATEILKNGDTVEVDAYEGTVKIIR